MTDVNLHDTFDASIWAKEFCRLFPGMDEGTMLGWFANAIMAGHDHALRKTTPSLRRLTKRFSRQAVANALDAVLPSNEKLPGSPILEVEYSADGSVVLTQRYD